MDLYNLVTSLETVYSVVPRNYFRSILHQSSPVVLCFILNTLLLPIDGHLFLECQLPMRHRLTGLAYRPRDVTQLLFSIPRCVVTGLKTDRVAQ